MAGKWWIAELVRRACGAASIQEFRREILTILRQVAPCDRAVFAELQRHNPITTLDVDRESLEMIRHCEQSLARYAGDLRKMFQTGLRVGGGTDRDTYSMHERHELPLFCDIIRPQRVRSTLFLVPKWQGLVLATIRLERCDDRSPFTPRDLEHALALLPSIELALTAQRFGPAHGPARPLPLLSGRESQVAHQVGRGLTNRQIALVLGTSPLTVRNQISRIFDKTGVACRAELATWISRSADDTASHGADVPFQPL